MSGNQEAERPPHEQHLSPEELAQGHKDTERYLAGDTTGWRPYEEIRTELLDRVTALARRKLDEWRRAV